MKRFAELYQALDRTNKSGDKIGLLSDYLREAPERDRLWAMYVFMGRRTRRKVTGIQLRQYAAEQAKLPPWLVDECLHSVGDLAETLALLLPPPRHRHALPLSRWMDFARTLQEQPEPVRRERLAWAWDGLTFEERLVFHKILTGELRIGVTSASALAALSQSTGVPAPLLAHRLTGDWDPETLSFPELASMEGGAAIPSQPYPFCLAHALETEPEKLGPREEWQAEWKWDGIRAQAVLRANQLFLWSRGEELVTERFPELAPLRHLGEGLVLDGEILPVKDGQVLPFAVLQTRLGRKNLGAKVLSEAPVAFRAYDLLEWQGEDWRARPLSERRSRLEELFQSPQGKLLREILSLSEVLPETDWEDLHRAWNDSRSVMAEGLMLKHLAAPYHVGRKRGDWWKWKVHPLTVDAILIYAQKGHGRRADLYTDYTFAVWEGEPAKSALVPFAKAYSGLTDAEIREADAFVRRHTRERFGPVRTVDPELVFEIAFEGIQPSKRHKSGVAVRFPRIARWRRDKPVAEADTLGSLRGLLDAFGKT